MLGPYFPDLDPKSNGDHLALAWQMARQTFQFFPWYDTSSAARVSNTEPPQAAVHAMAMAYLKAGPDYSRAYRAAFANERPETAGGGIPGGAHNPVGRQHTADLQPTFAASQSAAEYRIR